MRSGRRPVPVVPVVSLEVKKVGSVHSKANLTSLTASAPTTADCLKLRGTYRQAGLFNALNNAGRQMFYTFVPFHEEL